MATATAGTTPLKNDFIFYLRMSQLCKSVPYLTKYLSYFELIPVYFCLLYFRKINFAYFSHNYRSYSMFPNIPECFGILHDPGLIDGTDEASTRGGCLENYDVMAFLKRSLILAVFYTEILGLVVYLLNMVKIEINI